MGKAGTLSSKNILKMDTATKVTEALSAAIDEVNGSLPSNAQIGKTPDTPLFARDGVLDSIGLVNLIVATEQQVDEQIGISLTLADEKALSQSKSPFRTVGTFTEYIVNQIKNESGDQ